MDDLLNHQALENPFIPNRPARQKADFVGRSDILAGLLQELGHSGSAKKWPAHDPLVVNGPKGIGKTSLLYQLVEGTAGGPLNIVYTDVRDLDSSRLTSFLWQLAKSIMVGLEQQGVDGPRIEKRMLVLNPQLVFRQRFWNPLMAKAEASPIILAWDNFDSLSSHGQDNRTLPSLRAYLYDLLQSDAPIGLLLTVTGRVEAIGEDALAPFRLSRSHRLNNLSAQAALGLIQKSDRLQISQPVAEYILRLTAGHPGDTQKLCHVLFERHLARNHTLLTMADIIGALQDDLTPSDFVGTVYGRLNRSLALNR